MENYSLTPNKFLTDDELKLFLEKRDAKKGTRDGVILGILLYTGARQCEILAIRKNDIQSQGVFIFGRKKSKDGHQILPMEFYNELVEYIAHLKDEDLLFQVTTRTLRNVWYRFTPNHSKSLHSLRHTYGVKFYKATKDIRGTKNGLRHKNIKNTLIYLDYVDNLEIQKKVAETVWENKAA